MLLLLGFLTYYVITFPHLGKDMKIFLFFKKMLVFIMIWPIFIFVLRN